MWVCQPRSTSPPRLPAWKRMWLRPGHLGHQQAAPVAGREVRHHFVEPGRDAGAIAPVAAPGRLHDPDGRKAGAAQDPQGAVFALVLAPEDRPLHGAIMGLPARPVHRTMVRSLLSLTAARLRRAPARACRFRGGPRSRPVASPSETSSLSLRLHRSHSACHFMRQNSSMSSAKLGPEKSGVAPTIAGLSGRALAPSHGSGPCQTILFLMA